MKCVLSFDGSVTRLFFKNIKTPINTNNAIIFGIHPLLKEWINHREMINAIIIPIIGASKINDIVLKIGSELMAENPPYAMAAPAKAPISACDEDEGIPNHQVNKFQKIADSNPEKITSNISCPVTISGFTVLAIVLATPWSLKIK